MTVAVAVLSLLLVLTPGVARAQAPGSAAPGAARHDAAGRTQPGDIRGGWRAERYTMKEGASFTVDGQILFTGKDWTVLFLVMDNGQAARGAGEGGSYVVDGNRITLTHRYNVSAGKAVAGLPESPLRMERLADTDPKRIEPCTFEIAGDRLTLRFPSGNAMIFVRTS